jgi:hypothetical protein
MKALSKEGVSIEGRAIVAQEYIDTGELRAYVSGGFLVELGGEKVYFPANSFLALFELLEEEEPPPPEADPAADPASAEYNAAKTEYDTAKTEYDAGSAKSKKDKSY